MKEFSYTYTHPVIGTGIQTIWKKIDLPLFNELIVSWNALRPKRGFYRLSASLRTGGAWSPWLRYAEWSVDDQKTFASKPARSSAAAYQDIISLADGHMADGFRIKVQALTPISHTTSSKEDATDCIDFPRKYKKCRLSQTTLECFDTLYACTSNLQKFNIHPIPFLDPVKLSLESLHSQMALKHPRHKDLCSPTSTCMAIDFLLKKRFANPLDFAAKVHDSSFDIYGNWILNIAESYHHLSGRYHCRVARLPHFAELHRYLKQNLPVIVSIRGPLPNAPLPFTQGHLLLVFGWDPIGQRVFCADPAHPSDSDTSTSYPIHDFLIAWGRRKNLSYLFSPK